jgi:glutamine amidotransferase
MGWNELTIHRDTDLLAGIDDGDFFYFVHSYYCVPEDPGIIIATTDYGVDLACIVSKENVHAVQFHPEKSSKKGLRLLENFVEMTRC